MQDLLTVWDLQWQLCAQCNQAAGVTEVKLEPDMAPSRLVLVLVADNLLLLAQLLQQEQGKGALANTRRACHDKATLLPSLAPLAGLSQHAEQLPVAAPDVQVTTQRRWQVRPAGRLFQADACLCSEELLRPCGEASVPHPCCCEGTQRRDMKKYRKETNCHMFV